MRTREFDRSSRVVSEISAFDWGPSDAASPHDLLHRGSDDAFGFDGRDPTGAAVEASGDGPAVIVPDGAMRGWAHARDDLPRERRAPPHSGGPPIDGTAVGDEIEAWRLMSPGPDADDPRDAGPGAVASIGPWGGGVSPSFGGAGESDDEIDVAVTPSSGSLADLAGTETPGPRSAGDTKGAVIRPSTGGGASLATRDLPDSKGPPVHPAMSTTPPSFAGGGTAGTARDADIDVDPGSGAGPGSSGRGAYDSTSRSGVDVPQATRRAALQADFAIPGGARPSASKYLATTDRGIKVQLAAHQQGGLSKRPDGGNLLDDSASRAQSALGTGAMARGGGGGGGKAGAAAQANANTFRTNERRREAEDNALAASARARQSDAMANETKAKAAEAKDAADAAKKSGRAGTALRKAREAKAAEAAAKAADDKAKADAMAAATATAISVAATADAEAAREAYSAAAQGLSDREAEQASKLATRLIHLQHRDAARREKNKQATERREARQAAYDERKTRIHREGAEGDRRNERQRRLDESANDRRWGQIADEAKRSKSPAEYAAWATAQAAMAMESAKQGVVAATAAAAEPVGSNESKTIAERASAATVAAAKAAATGDQSGYREAIAAARAVAATAAARATRAASATRQTANACARALAVASPKASRAARARAKAAIRAARKAAARADRAARRAERAEKSGSPRQCEATANAAQAEAVAAGNAADNAVKATDAALPKKATREPEPREPTDGKPVVGKPAPGQSVGAEKKPPPWPGEPPIDCTGEVKCPPSHAESGCKPDEKCGTCHWEPLPTSTGGGKAKDPGSGPGLGGNSPADSNYGTNGPGGEIPPTSDPGSGAKQPRDVAPDPCLGLASILGELDAQDRECTAAANVVSGLMSAIFGGSDVAGRSPSSAVGSALQMLGGSASSADARHVASQFSGSEAFSALLPALSDALSCGAAAHKARVARLKGLRDCPDALRHLPSAAATALWSGLGGGGGGASSGALAEWLRRDVVPLIVDRLSRSLDPVLDRLGLSASQRHAILDSVRSEFLDAAERNITAGAVEYLLAKIREAQQLRKSWDKDGWVFEMALYATFIGPIMAVIDLPTAVSDWIKDKSWLGALRILGDVVGAIPVIGAVLTRLGKFGASIVNRLRGVRSVTAAASKASTVWDRLKAVRERLRAAARRATPRKGVIASEGGGPNAIGPGQGGAPGRGVAKGPPGVHEPGRPAPAAMPEGGATSAPTPKPPPPVEGPPGGPPTRNPPPSRGGGSGGEPVKGPDTVHVAEPPKQPPGQAEPLMNSTTARDAVRDRYLSRSGGRWGGTATRRLNDRLATELEAEGFTITGGAGLPEEWFAGSGGGTAGGTFVDITATDGTRVVRIQTVSTLADGVTPTPSEAAAAARIREKFPNDTLRIVPKQR